MEPHIPSSRLSLYGQELGLGNRSSLMEHSGGPVVTQIAEPMQIPLAYAEDIIGVQGTNIDYIRCSSGAILSVEESRGLPEEITAEIKGTSSQVHAAQLLIQEFISGASSGKLPKAGVGVFSTGRRGSWGWGQLLLCLHRMQEDSLSTGAGGIAALGFDSIE